MTGHIRQRSPGSWEIRYRVKGKVTTCTFRGSKRDADRRLRELPTPAGRGIARAKGTCGAWFDAYLKAIRNDVAPLTLRLYNGWIERVFRPTFGDIRLSELDAATIRAAWGALADRGMAPASIRQAHRCLSA